MSTTPVSTNAIWRGVFVSTAVFNVTVAVSLLFAPAWIFIELGFRPVPEPTVFVHAFAVAVALFGLGYYLVSLDPTQRALVQLGLLSKLSVFGLMLGHVWIGDATWHFLALGCVDLFYAALFVVFLRRAPEASRTKRWVPGAA